MDVESWQAPKNEPEGQIIAGVRKNPDGTLDYSKAAYVQEDAEEMQKRADLTKHSIEESEQKKAQERKEKTTIPKTVKPGSSEMVSKTLDVALFLNKERLEKTKSEGKQDANTETLIRSQQLQRNAYHSIILSHTTKLERDGSMNNDQIREKMNNLSALEMAELVRDTITELETIRDNNQTKEVQWFGSEMLPVQDAIKVAEKLEEQLLKEAPRLNQKEVYGRDDVTESEAAQIDSIREKINPVSELRKDLKKKVSEELGLLEPRLQTPFYTYNASFDKLSDDQFKQFAEEISEIGKAWRNDSRPSFEKNKGYATKINDVLNKFRPIK